MPDLPPTKESGIDGIETDPNEIAPMALFGLLIKEQEVETLAKAYLDMRETLRDHVGIHEVERIERRFRERPE